MPERHKDLDQNPGWKTTIVNNEQNIIMYLVLKTKTCLLVIHDVRVQFLAFLFILLSQWQKHNSHCILSCNLLNQRNEQYPMNYSTCNHSFLPSNPHSHLSPSLFLRYPLKINILHLSSLPIPIISIHSCAKESKVGIRKCNMIYLSVKWSVTLQKFNKK